MRHTAEFDGELLKKAMGFFGEQHRVTSQEWNDMSTRKVSDQERQDFFCKLLGFKHENLNLRDRDGKKLVSTRAENQL